MVAKLQSRALWKVRCPVLSVVRRTALTRQYLFVSFTHRRSPAGAAGVTICGRSEDKGAAVVAEIAALDLAGKAIYVKADLTNPADIEMIAAKTDLAFGKCDGLVNFSDERAHIRCDNASIATIITIIHFFNNQPQYMIILVFCFLLEKLNTF